MYHDLLKQIESEMRRFGMALQPPCSSAQLETLRRKAVQHLGNTIPDAYIAFLIDANGLDWNGLVVYATERTPIVGYPDRFIEGFVEGNLSYRDYHPLKDYLIFAEDGVVLFTYRLSASEYQIVTTVGLSLLESFKTFDELMANALKGHL
jgi:hypothetical protein